MMEIRYVYLPIPQYAGNYHVLQVYTNKKS